jgi:hypothetical protein
MNNVFVATLLLFLALGTATVAVGIITHVLLRIQEWLEHRERKARHKARHRGD